ncbi:glycosyltransferase family 4 protein [Halorussus halophilus]|uniref:glycosyltransferase family 4 protein n=1 Tax=Halorussus halophilus TaxID=2650975 RepID=UPI0013011972|nr:glycosyltransferase family 4 protein [Halorussus halophilus]
MKVSHYFEWESAITGGHHQSVQNQRKILEERGIDYTTDPTTDADLLHLNNMGPRSVFYAAKARRNDVPVLVHAHQTAEDFEESFAFSNVLAKPLKPYLRRAYSLADHLVCPSEHTKAVMEGYTDTPKTVVSNGFDAEKLDGFESLRQEYLERYDLDPPVVFNVAHVIERKGLRSFVETARRMPDTDFVWFGYLNPTGNDGVFDRLLTSSKVEELVENAPQNCTFTGYVEDIRGAFAAGDVFFFPTKNENEGMALLEAMSCGTPPVIRNIDTYHWLEDGRHCLKAEGSFEEELLKLIEDEQRRRELGETAEQKSREFRLANVGDELVELYQRLV